MSLPRRLRDSICSEFLEVGALAPTLCEGWQAQDLAAHLWVRERRIDALPGIGMKRFAPHTERVQREAMHSRGFDSLVSDLRRPRFPMGVGPAALAEYAIHHVDLSRANDRELELSDDDQRKLWPYAKAMLRAAAKNYGGKVSVSSTTGKGFTTGQGNRPVHVSGDPLELLYLASGRVDHARVEITAEPDARQEFLDGIRGL